MNALFIELLAATQVGVTPDAPTAANLTTYGASLVQVNWTNANGGTKQTRVYRRFHAGAWSLQHTVVAGTELYQTVDSAASGYSYGVSHYDSLTGLESSIRAATALPPDAPIFVEIYNYGPGLAKIGIEWENTESLPIRCYRNGVLVTTKSAGETMWDSGYTSGSLAVAHYDSSTGQESERVGAA